MGLLVLKLVMILLCQGNRPVKISKTINWRNQNQQATNWIVIAVLVRQSGGAVAGGGAARHGGGVAIW